MADANKIATLKMVTYNARGLNVPQKRSQILYHFHKSRTHILLFQETHFKTGQIPTIKNRYYNTWFHSTNDQAKSKGVSIAIHKSLSYQIIDSKVDPLGRYLFLKLQIYGKKVTLANLYIPNTNQVSSILQIIDWLTDFAEGTLLIGGDWNCVMDPKIDTSSGKSAVPRSHIKKIKRFLGLHGLIDIWRLLNPTGRDYTYFSSVHDSYSRIDMFLCSQHTLTLHPSVTMDNFLWSDHAPVYLVVDIPEVKSSQGSWKLNDNLLEDEICKLDLIQSISNFIEDHRLDTTHPTIKWEALKCVLRGVLIKHGSRLKKARIQEIKDKFKLISTLEKNHKKSLDPKILLNLSHARNSLITLLNQKTLAIRDKMRRIYYEHGDKPGKLLAKALHARNTYLTIPAIQTLTGRITHNPKEIVKVFHDYYKDLYNIQCTTSEYRNLRNIEEMHQYIQDTALPTISGVEREELEKPLTKEELNQTIKKLIVGKSPGPDGFTPRFYKQLGEFMAPVMLRSFNSIDAISNFPPQSLEARVVVIPKIGKDLTQCGSYRPISLTNIDIRLYSKILANRLHPLIASLIHPDQTGFTPGREVRDNIYKTISLIELAHSRETPMCLLAVDAEKAFDRVAWPFLRETLVQIGIGPQYLSKIMTLYNNPTARIATGGEVSDPVNIGNGTRQGCPISPLLYILTMEHLAMAIRANKDIKGLQIADSSYKLSLYADDLLLYVTSPHISIPSLISEFQRFGRVSNFKVNMDKTEALNINLPLSTLNVLEKNFSFKWQSSQLKYLGVQITNKYEDLFNSNYNPLIRKIKDLLDSYSKITLSWVGRVNIVKMDILPKILFFFQALPIDLPRQYILNLNCVIRRFIWNNKHPRVNKNTLILPKKRGGLAVPNLLLYYQASVLNRVMDWYHQKKSKLWIKLERDASHFDLETMLHIPKTNRKITGNLLSLVCNTYKIWDNNIMKKQISSWPNPLLPLFGNPDFPPARDAKHYLIWEKNENPSIASILENNMLFSLQDILEHCHNTSLAWFEYSQLKHFLNNLPNTHELVRMKTPLEKLLTAAHRPEHALSQIYSILLEEAYPDPPTYVKVWERELGEDIGRIDWNKAFMVTHRMSIASVAQERNYKILSRWYRCPDVLNKITPSNSPQCWRCGWEVGSMTHIWGTCSKVAPFWEEVFREYRNISRSDTLCTISIILFSIIPGTMNSIKNDILRHCITAARTVIARLWRSEVPPNLYEWIKEMDNIHLIEKMYLQDSNKSELYTQVWSAWVQHRDKM